jgi:hypothetical protein
MLSRPLTASTVRHASFHSYCNLGVTPGQCTCLDKSFEQLQVQIQPARAGTEEQQQPSIYHIIAFCNTAMLPIIGPQNNAT